MGAMAFRKESLWVKWVNVIKLKHMKYKIGDGKIINVWHDKWNSDTSSSSIISKKEVFYAGFQDLNCIADVLIAFRYVGRI